MALTDENGGIGMTMPVQPMNYGYQSGGFGNGFGDGGWWWLILLFLVFGNNGWGNGFGGGFGSDGLYPWMNQSNQMNNGFRDQMLNSSIDGIQNSITTGFGEVQTALCGGFAGVNASINGAANGLSQQMNANQLAALERSFAAQTASTQGMTALQSQLAQCCCDNRAATADLKYTVATENCADRAALADGIRDIMENCNRNNQAVLDKLCALELDGVKGQLAQAQRDNVALQNAVNMATLRESQTAQTAQIMAGQSAAVNGLVTELRSCPIPSQPVYGSQPIFTCGGGNYSGCGCGVA